MHGVTGALAQKDIPVSVKPTSMTAMKSFPVTAPRPALVSVARINVTWAPEALEYAVGTRFPKAVRALVARAGAVLFRPSALPVQRGVPDTKGFRFEG